MLVIQIYLSKKFRSFVFGLCLQQQQTQSDITLAEISKPDDMKTHYLVIICNFFFGLATNISYSQTETNTSDYPNMFVCKLVMKIGNASYNGTGVIINENTILTNAHNVYGKDSIIAYPGQSRTNPKPYGVIKVKCEKLKNIFYPKEFDDDDSSYDFAIIKFDNTDVIDNLRNASRGNFPSLEYIENFTEINITGYPIHRWFELKSDRGKVQYHNSTTKFEIVERENLINYKLNARGGSSGSPLWTKVEDKYYIIGIHKSGKIKRNQGVLYDQNRIELILSWINKP